jgi:formylmethanofuran--tetrahydromethanopterin N-formyltransferase
MEINGVEIEDTFAEAFPMTAARVVITAETARWARTAAEVATGYATSVIACDAEAGIERELAAEATPDGRPGVSVLVFAFNRERLEKALVGRVGQCVLTCATTACYDGLAAGMGGEVAGASLPLRPPPAPPCQGGEQDEEPSQGGERKEKRVRVGGNLRFFGDGFQISKRLEFADPETGQTHKRRFWRVPVMDGEFTCEDYFGTVKGVAGGNFLILGESQQAALEAAEAAAEAIGAVPECILPFPGGIVRSGSKVGSKYKALRASTNDAYCPTLRGMVESALPEGTGAVYEIVIDGLSLAAVEEATRVGVRAACRPGVLRISAGNYGGNLGPHHIYLRRVLGGT